MTGYYRLVLAWMVVAEHTWGFPGDRWPNVGLVAVAVFFFISGYLMPLAFDRNYHEGDFWRRTGSFLWNRFLRIYPVYWLALLIMIGIYARFAKLEWPFALAHPSVFLKNIGLLSLSQAELWGHDLRFIGPAWTLDVELQYYLLVPFLVAFFGRWPRAALMVFGLASLPGLLLFLAPSESRGLMRSLVVWFPVFALGFAFAHCREPLRSRGMLRLVIAGAAVLLLAAAAAGFSLVHAETLPTISLILAAALILTARLRLPHDTLAGDLSYLVYIFHPLITNLNFAGRPFKLAGIPDPGYWPLLIANLVIATAIAYAVDVLIMRRLSAYRMRFKSGEGAAALAERSDIDLVPVLEAKPAK